MVALGGKLPDLNLLVAFTVLSEERGHVSRVGARLLLSQLNRVKRAAESNVRSACQARHDPS